MPAYTLQLRCPNCDTSFDKLDATEITRPDTGDRILVHKWPFDIGGAYLGPHRWDVTVFKDPRDGTTNFIKRLVGLPGEVIQIIDGDVCDVYRVPIRDLSAELVAQMDQLRRDVYQLRLPENRTKLFDNRRRDETKREFMRRYAEINEQLLALLKIERKLPGRTMAQESLWFNVYDHDFLPSYAAGGSAGSHSRCPWQPSGGAASQAWDTRSREISFRSDSSEPLELLFTEEIDDFYAYNVESQPGRGHRPAQYVGDVRLRFVWFPDAGEGGLRLSMNRDEDQFIATIGVDGSVRLEGLQPALEGAARRQTLGESKLDVFSPGRPVPIEFINLDYRVALFVNGQEVIASTPEQYSPQIARLKRLITATLRESDGYVEVKPTQIRMSAHQLQCRLRHVVVERDVYYRSQEQQEPEARDEQQRTIDYNPYYLWPGWGTAGMPLMLREAHEVNGRLFGGEYYMLGDNSPASKDSRLWWEIGAPLLRLGSDYQVGTVPDDQLIGKAFFVYWPAGYRPSWAPRIGLIPNFGRMRWIR
jgi:signal peptidase I